MNSVSAAHLEVMLPTLIAEGGYRMEHLVLFLVY